ncbi:hypothetical protein HHI36_015939 [Cryptolaemus montrouzieri]|uniref:Neuropeptide-like 1 n=1 Tax=Cryptolaemus montrouzieri TaxID=559131 RepID=A0ABD2N734_9CUCU
MIFRRFRCRFAVAFLLTFVFVVQSDDSCNLDFERTISTIFSPQEQPTVQIRTLRRYMLRLLQNMVAKAEELEGWNTYVYPKRNLEALARAGYLHTLPEEDEDNQTNSHDKRSLASLVKNGQLPEHHYGDEEGNKRSMESLNRNGEFRKYILKMLEELENNGALLADNYSKRNLASIAREGGFGGKRNAAALLKNDRYLNQMLGPGYDSKRNLASVRASYRPSYKSGIVKREIDYDNDVEAPTEYENLVEELLEGQRSQKRFLGSIARTGWYDSARKSGQRLSPDKRHIGSLARLGWLPTIRNVRRFSRSGRSSDGGSCRQASSNGQEQDYYFSENSIPLDNKRFLPVPAMWKVPLQTVNY